MDAYQLLIERAYITLTDVSPETLSRKTAVERLQQCLGNHHPMSDDDATRLLDDVLARHGVKDVADLAHSKVALPHNLRESREACGDS